MKKFRFGLMAVLASLISLYPLQFVFATEDVGLLLTKTAELLGNSLWQWGFYLHILLGGLALLTGWSQFHSGWRKSKVQWHRRLGQVYILAVLISSIAGTGIGFAATGGWIAKTGFIALGLVWFLTTLLAYQAVRSKDFRNHQKWMTYSYAACFGAVTLRLWLPLLILVFGGFITAYKIVAWLAWVPNLCFAYWLLKSQGFAGLFDKQKASPG